METTAIRILSHPRIIKRAASAHAQKRGLDGRDRSGFPGHYRACSWRTRAATLGAHGHSSTPARCSPSPAYSMNLKALGHSGRPRLGRVGLEIQSEFNTTPCFMAGEGMPVGVYPFPHKFFAMQVSP